MTTKRKIMISLGSLLGLGFLLFAVLIIHIAIMVKSRKPLENATIQMARTDFRQPVDATALEKIRTQLMTLRGVKDTYFNPGSNILIYTFDAKQNNAQNIYNTAIKASGIPSAIHIVSQAEAAKGCPAMDNHSFYGKLTALVERAL